MMMMMMQDVTFTITGIVASIVAVTLAAVVVCTLARYYSLSKRVDVLSEGVRCFDGKGYGGQEVVLPPGYYASVLEQHTDALNSAVIKNVTIPIRLVRSILVPRGYMVTLYANETLQGEHIVLRSSVPDLDLIPGSTTRVKTERGTWYNKAHGLAVVVTETLPDRVRRNARCD